MCGGAPKPKPTAADRALAKRTAQQAQFDQDVILPIRQQEMERALDPNIDRAVTSVMQGRAAADAAVAERNALQQQITASVASGTGPNSGNVSTGVDRTLRAGGEARLAGLISATGQAQEQRRNERASLLDSAAGNSGQIMTSLADRARVQEGLALSRMQNQMATSQAWGKALTTGAAAVGMQAHNQWKQAGNSDIATEDLGWLGGKFRNYQEGKQAETYNMMSGGAFAGADANSLRAREQTPVSYTAPTNPMYTMAGYV